MNLSSPDWSLVAAFGLIQAVTILAIWLALKRLRRWKEQILHGIAVLESNSHQDQIATRGEMVATVEQRIGQDLAGIREALRGLRERGDLRDLVKRHAECARLEATPGPNDRYAECVEFLQSLDHATEASREYLSTHLHRTARTLALAPPPLRGGRALELGSYMYMAPALGCLLGYGEVRGAYIGAPGWSVKRAASSQGKVIFECETDIFNAEKDRYPYPDGHFDLVLACEILEHMSRDPMFLLLECARVLCDGGALIVTTPNVVSYTSVARALTAGQNPQVYSLYPWVETESPHVREYTPRELRDAIAAAGLQVEYLFTEKIGGYDSDVWVGELLKQLDLPGALRGEQLYCLARKRGGATTVRRPEFLYERQPAL
ncbi:MAG: methyltransferase domain-containing protein [Bryobacteraceae bacterium]|jgi:SAM-dependent methyltransferase